MPNLPPIPKYELDDGVLSAADVKAQVNRVQEVMRAVMIRDTHYGTVPGTDKPSLYKAGAEVLLSTFRIAVDPEVIDLSTDDEIRYRVRAVGRHILSHNVVGAGVGEASTSEDKYRWRAAVSQAEFDATPENRRRLKYQRGGGTVAQVRTSPADLANTVLKMAKKRAQIDLCLTALAASDIFTQDVEDMPDELRGSHAERRPDPPPRPTPARPAGERLATEKQISLVRRKLEEHGTPESALLARLELGELAALPMSRVDEALELLKNGDV